MEQIMEYRKTYKEYKEELDGIVKRTAEGFVEIGYMLKVARDTNILAESGYKSMAEFAEAEYNLNKTQVSRFININDKFSEGGYSDRLEERYRGFGYAKLTLMLQLPDEINNVLTPDFSKAEIQEIKDEVDEERKISDIEVMLEGEEPKVAAIDSMPCKIIRQLGEDEPELYIKVFDSLKDTEDLETAVTEAMAPNGEKLYSVRLRGIGRWMLSIKASEDMVTIINVRTDEKITFNKAELVSCWQQILVTDAQTDSAMEQWEAVYGRDYPGKEKIAPVQQAAEPPKQEKKPRKESKVSKAKKPEPVKTKKELPKVAEPEEEQLPGQTSIEADFPEMVPESAKSTPEPVEITEVNPNEELERQKRIRFEFSQITSKLYACASASAMAAVLKELADKAERIAYAEDYNEI